jgi:X-Pro dipeptidyl-peptidase
MKYNQYGYLQTDFDQMVKELESINFLPGNWKENSFSDLLATLVEIQLRKQKLMVQKKLNLQSLQLAQMKI